MFKKLLGRKRQPLAPTSESAAMSADPLDPSLIKPDVAAFLHGRLTIRVIEARNVEGKSATFLGKIERAVTSSIDGVDPYCSVKLGYNKIMQTAVVTNSASPTWNSVGVFDIAHDFYALEFRIKAAKRSGPLSIISKVKHLSMLSISAVDIKEKKHLSGWFPLGVYQREVVAEGGDEELSSEEENPEDVPLGSFGDLRIEVLYEPVTESTRYNEIAVPDLYFPVRTGVKFSMFQDADVPPGLLPPVPGMEHYEHGRCWVELAKAIMSATEFIYITGWAVWPQLVMVRTDDGGEEWKDLTLGQMLVQKAEEGVKVLVMVWDELASNFFSSGMMGTHDEEVVAYFKKTKVHCIKVGRQNPKEGPLSDLNDSLLFTHHQKTVILTRSDPESGKNRVEAWVGGLDLTDGRYDNPQHSLFRTLDGVHSDPDFWQACALGVTSKSGPREPWQDIHSRVTGKAAWDVLTNFEGRWKRQGPDSLRSALHPLTPETVVQADEEGEIQDGDWNVQVLRSINETSTALNRERPGLIVRKSAHVDLSIHDAYVHQIRSAKHFIYFENQYFLSSSHLWSSGQRGGFASNLIAIEIAEKICAKIRSNQRFVVYVVVPMFPEGPPDSGAVQEILSHQRKTVALITSRIAKAIKETGSDTMVSDWFNIFCLVNRESEDGGKGDGGTAPIEQTLSKSRRFMIYVHSKFAVFDDTVAIIGSANINSRSMDGSRDTEIALMGWQPEHVASGSNGFGNDAGGENSLPLGDVAAFRRSIWMEHLDDTEPVSDMPHGHLALYPYEVDQNTGDVTSTHTSFPDFPAALVKGKATPGIPNMLTG